MSKYKVKTGQFRFLEKGEKIDSQDTHEFDSQWVHFGLLIENFPNWFEKIEDEWEVEDTFIGKAVSNKETQQRIISFIGELSDTQAEAIATALNELD